MSDTITVSWGCDRYGNTIGAVTVTHRPSTYRLLQMLPEAREDKRPEVLAAVLGEIGVDSQCRRMTSRAASSNPLHIDYYYEDGEVAPDADELQEIRRDAVRLARERQGDPAYWLAWRGLLGTTSIGDTIYSTMVESLVAAYSQGDFITHGNLFNSLSNSYR